MSPGRARTRSTSPRRLIAARPDVNLTADDDWTPLIQVMYADPAVAVPVAQLLLQAGADASIVNNEGNSALMLASHRDMPVLIPALVKAGADINERGRDGTSLVVAADEGHTAVVRALLDANADPNLGDRHDETPLMKAAKKDHVEIIALLSCSLRAHRPGGQLLQVERDEVRQVRCGAERASSRQGCELQVVHRRSASRSLHRSKEVRCSLQTRRRRPRWHAQNSHARSPSIPRPILPSTPSSIANSSVTFRNSLKSPPSIGIEGYNDHLHDASALAVARRKAHVKSVLVELAAFDPDETLRARPHLAFDDGLRSSPPGCAQRALWESSLRCRQRWLAAINRVRRTSRRLSFARQGDALSKRARLRQLPQAPRCAAAPHPTGNPDHASRDEVRMDAAASGDGARARADHAVRRVGCHRFAALRAVQAVSARRPGGETNSASPKPRAKCSRIACSPSLRRSSSLSKPNICPRARDELASSKLPAGKRYYDLMVATMTTTDLTADQIHAIGLAEVARIRTGMEKVIASTDFKGTFAEFVQSIKSDPKFFHTSADGMLMHYRDIAKRADAALPALFAELPRVPYGIRPMEAYEGDNAEHYTRGALDGSRAGYFEANTNNLQRRAKYEMEAVLLHETVPGHHLQIARAQEMKGLPQFRRTAWYTAYGEGWGALRREPRQRDGHVRRSLQQVRPALHREMWRACRLVIDTGLHAFGWSRDQAIRYLVDNAGIAESGAIAETDRYILNPGQALGYKIGELRIKALRAKAQTALGDRFDIRRFHNALLDDGALPLTAAGSAHRRVDRDGAGEK